MDTEPTHDHSPDAEPSIDTDALKACADLVDRAGAKGLAVGHLHKDVPSEEAAWWAMATYRGTKLIAENHRGPVEALEALVSRLLTGGKCVRCGGLIVLSDEGAVTFPNAIVGNGTRWTEQAIRAAPQCRWRRIGPRWEPGCPSSHPAAPGDEIHTTEILARALEALNDPVIEPIISKARAGYYHDFLSPLDDPPAKLIEHLRSAGHDAFAQRVIDGEFDASAAESRQWAASAEGKATFAALVPGAASTNRGSRRAAAREANRGKRRS